MSCDLGSYDDPAPWLTDPESYPTDADREAYTAERNALLAACAAAEKAAPLKAHLNVTDDADDQLLADKLDAAIAYTSHQLGITADDDPLLWETATPDLRQAVLMLAGHWFENREATLVGVGAELVPLGYDDLLLAHRRWVF